MTVSAQRSTRRRFLRAFRKALVDEGTYDVRENPSLWLGFLLALPIPWLAHVGGAPAWIQLLSIPAPITWAILLGAAGRVGILADRETRRLQEEVEVTRAQAEATEEELHEVSAERRRLAKREEAVLSELKLAQDIQNTLLPKNIQRQDVEVAVRQIPSQFVGGDYLNTVVVEDRYLYLVIGDVSGHGIAAALVVARLHGLIRRNTLENRRPEAIIERVNRACLTIFRHTYFFLTFAIFRLDLETGHLEYATAGHPAQVLLREDGNIELLRTRNRLLGMDSDVFSRDGPTKETKLLPGDTLVLYSDGLFEILGGPTGDLLGEHGLHDRIESLTGMTPALMIGEILQELATFQGHTKFEDDVSLMVAQYKGAPSARRRFDAG